MGTEIPSFSQECAWTRETRRTELALVEYRAGQFAIVAAGAFVRVNH